MKKLVLGLFVICLCPILAFSITWTTRSGTVIDTKELVDTDSVQTLTNKTFILQDITANSVTTTGEVHALDMEVTRNGTVESLTIGDVIHFNSLTDYKFAITIADEATATLEANVSGYGELMAGSDVEYVKFKFKNDGTVTLLESTTNVLNTDTDGYLCIFDTGTTVTIRNRLGSSYKIRGSVQYASE